MQLVVCQLAPCPPVKLDRQVGCWCVCGRRCRQRCAPPDCGSNVVIGYAQAQVCIQGPEGRRVSGRDGGKHNGGAAVEACAQISGRTHTAVHTTAWAVPSWQEGCVAQAAAKPGRQHKTPKTHRPGQTVHCTALRYTALDACTPCLHTHPPAAARTSLRCLSSRPNAAGSWSRNTRPDASWRSRWLLTGSNSSDSRLPLTCAHTAGQSMSVAAGVRGSR